MFNISSDKIREVIGTGGNVISSFIEKSIIMLMIFLKMNITLKMIYKRFLQIIWIAEYTRPNSPTRNIPLLFHFQCPVSL